MPDYTEDGPGDVPGEKGDEIPNIEFSVLLDCGDSSCRKLLDDIELELETMMPGTVLKAMGGCRCGEEVRRLCQEIGDELISAIPGPIQSVGHTGCITASTAP